MENETVFAKMTTELEKARNNQHNHDLLVKHISNIQLLCELFLEHKPDHSVEHTVGQQKSGDGNDHYTEAELKTMLGTAKSSTKPDGEDDMSIFDF